MWIYVEYAGRLTWDHFPTPTPAALLQFMRAVPEYARVFVRVY